MPLMKYSDKRLGAEKRAIIRASNRILQAYAAQDLTMTLRQLYYQLVAHDLFPDDRRWTWDPGKKKWFRDPGGTKNADPNYDWLGTAISEGRECGLVDWEHVTDRLRKIRRQPTWGTPREIMGACAEQFRYDLWVGQPRRVEVWIEKEALGEIVERACQPLQTPFMVCRGYMSSSACWEAGQRYRIWDSNGQRPVMLHFGDHDPSGCHMTVDNQDRLSRYSGVEVEVKRIALTMPQIRQYDPPPNPAKMKDARAAAYVAEHGYSSWEIDALPPDVLVSLIREAIQAEIEDGDAWDAAQERQEIARRALGEIEKSWRDVAVFAMNRAGLEDADELADALDPEPPEEIEEDRLYDCRYCDLSFVDAYARGEHEMCDHEEDDDDDE